MPDKYVWVFVLLGFIGLAVGFMLLWTVMFDILPFAFSVLEEVLFAIFNWIAEISKMVLS